MEKQQKVYFDLSRDFDTMNRTMFLYCQIDAINRV